MWGWVSCQDQILDDILRQKEVALQALNASNLHGFNICFKHVSSVHAALPQFPTFV